MKIHKKTSANKLLVRFDNELKTILVNDLNHIRNVKHQFLRSNHQARLQVS
ncbi:MAG: hypothetical protein JWP78_3737 [Mucilaginibacter sp.]|nr:hypothetical protein [Mucilaginibacter sp.]